MASLGRIRAGQAEVEVVLRDQKFQQSLRHVEYRLRQLQIGLPRFNFSTGLPSLTAMLTGVNKLGVSLKVVGDRFKVVADSLTGLGSAFLGSGLAGLFAVSLPVRDYAEFSDLIQELKARTGATADEIDKLRNQAKVLGGTTSFSPQEVAKGQVELGAGGFNAREIEEATESVLALARAGGSDLAQAGDTVVRVIRSFNKETSETPHVVDVITGSINQSTQVLDDYAEAIKTVGASANVVNASLEDVSAAIGVLADNGIRGTLAGTKLQRLFLNMANPDLQRQFTELIGTFGGTAPAFADAEGNMRPFIDVLRDLDRATAGFGNQEKLAVFEKLFGLGTNAALILSGRTDLIEGFSKFLQDAEGTTQRAAEIMDAQIGGGFRRVQSAVEDLGLTIGEKFEPVLLGLTDVIQLIVTDFNNLVKVSGNVVIGFGAVAAASVAAGTTLLGVGTAVRLVGFALSGLGVVIQLAAGAMTLLTTPTAVALTSVAALGAVLLQFTESGRAAMEAFSATVARVFARLGNSFKAFQDALAAGELGLAFRILRLSAQSEILHLQLFIEEKFGQSIQAIREAFSADGAASALSSFVGVFTTFFGDLANDAVRAMTVTRDLVVSAWETFVAVSIVTGQAIVSAWNATWSAITSTISGVLQGIGNEFAFALGPVLPVLKAVAGVIADFFVGAVSIAASTARTLYAIFNSVGQVLFNMYVSVIQGLYNLAYSVGTTIQNVLVGVVTVTASIIAAVFPQFAAFVTGIYDMFVGVFSSVYDVMASVFQGIVTLLTPVLEHLINAWTGVFSGLIQSALNFGYFLSTMWANVVGEITDTFGELDDNWSRAVDGMFNSWSDFVASLQKIWAVVGTYIVKVVTHIGSSLAGLFDQLSAFLGFETNTRKFFDDFQKNLDEGLDDRLTAIERKQRQAGERITKDSEGRQETLREKLAQAQAEVDKAAIAAAEERKKKLAEIAKVEAGLQQFARPDLERKFGEEEFDAGQTVDKTLKSVGAFNVAAALRIGTATPIDKQQLEASKKIAKGVVEVAENTAPLKRAKVK